MEKISFVIPCYRSEHTVESVVDEISRIMGNISEYNYEIILVNDSSPDRVWDVISGMAERDGHIVGVDLARNFGQPSAVMAGFSQVTGDYVITLDDDGQSPVDATKDIITKLKMENFDVVYGVCKQAKFSFIRRIGSKINASMASYAFNRPKDRRIISFCIYRRFVIDEMKKYHNSYTYLSGLTYRTTKNIGYLDVVHRSRLNGTSGYSLKKLFGLWINGLTAFTIRPLRIATYTGCTSGVIGFIMALIVIIKKILNPSVSAGWSSIVSIMLILNGLSFVIMGLLGEYVGRIYMSINDSPQYVIRQVLNRDIKE